MKTRNFVLSLILSIFPIPAYSQVVVKAAKLLDVRKGSYVENAAIWIESERIKDVGPFVEVLAHAPKTISLIDLGQATVRMATC